MKVHLKSKDCEMSENPPPPNNILSKEQISKILKYLSSNYDHKLWIQVLFSMGLHLSEFIEIKVRDIDLHKRKMIVTSKGRAKVRELMIPNRLLPDLQREMSGKSESELLFTGNRGKLHTRTIQKVFEKIKRDLSIPISNYYLRNSLAYYLMKEGWDDRSISRFLGCSLFYTRKMLKKFSQKFHRPHPLDSFLEEKS